MTKKISNELKGILTQMFKPLNNIELKIVIEGLTGYTIKPFNKNSEKDNAVLRKLIEVANISMNVINKNGIDSERVNEVGNKVEHYVIDALNSIKYKADIPETKKGRKKTTGYPDIYFIDEFKEPNYLECKTFNIENINSSQRSFYLSPSKNFKITDDARHFGLSFEVIKKENGKYYVKSWKILDLSGIKLNLKYEFNTHNKELYKNEHILAESNQ